LGVKRGLVPLFTKASVSVPGIQLRDRGLQQIDSGQ
jgi:hypothetical protein